jgi:Ran GTPase-activating protein (RanGAP) involved in mRNA processing and transport
VWPNSSLQRLSLRKATLTDSSAHVIADALARNASLKSIDLSANRIGRDGAERIAKALTENGKLATLVNDDLCNWWKGVFFLYVSQTVQQIKYCICHLL